MRWKWTVRKMAISLFVLAHAAALVAWNVSPKVALRERIAPILGYYMLPTGLWRIFVPASARLIWPASPHAMSRKAKGLAKAAASASWRISATCCPARRCTPSR